MKKKFKEIYAEAKNNPTPAQRFIAEVAAVTLKSEATVRMWLSGYQKPDDLTRKAIADHFGVDADYLFAEDAKSSDLGTRAED